MRAINRLGQLKETNEQTDKQTNTNNWTKSKQMTAALNIRQENIIVCLLILAASGNRLILGWRLPLDSPGIVSTNGFQRRPLGPY